MTITTTEIKHKDFIVDTRLITAAPDLLEALKDSRDELNFYLAEMRLQKRPISKTLKIRDNINAAIAKAEGK